MRLYMLLPLLIVGVCGSEGRECVGSSVGVYELRVETGWSRDAFPKMYPEWRPPAQWSKTVGRSHDSSFHIFRVGEKATEGLKKFAEKGDTTNFNQISQGGPNGVLDAFFAPPIPEGVGVSQAQFFVDGNHSRVSLISRIVPSPDWFIGVDSFDLCSDGQWIESVVLEVDPLDAGTDDGFTFTSPNWPSVPLKPITRITSQNPSHPAGSFYYPDKDQHPPIATLYLAKVREYQLAQVFSPPHPSDTPTRLTSADLTGPSHKPRSRPRITPLNREEKPTHNELENEESNSILPNGDMTVGESEAMTSAPKPPHIINSFVKKYKNKFRKNRRGRKMGSRRNGRRGGRRRIRVPRDCRVTEWAQWSECSKTCGIGEQMRTRAVLRPSRRGGRPCPTLKENKWCGSSRDCDHRYFDW